jgi:hypothetical protein
MKVERSRITLLVGSAAWALGLAGPFTRKARGDARPPVTVYKHPT